MRNAVEVSSTDFTPALLRLLRLGPIHRRTTHHRTHDLDVLDFISIDVMGIVGEDDEVRQFARRDTALYVFLEGGIGAIHGADP